MLRSLFIEDDRARAVPTASNTVPVPRWAVQDIIYWRNEACQEAVSATSRKEKKRLYFQIIIFLRGARGPDPPPTPLLPAPSKRLAFLLRDGDGGPSLPPVTLD